MRDLWRLWQLADSAFPTGGFVHSGGLEAAWHLRLDGGGGIEGWVRDAIHHHARSTLPLLVAAYRAPQRLIAWDALSDAWTSNVISNNASRAQGQAWLTTCAQSFPESGCAAVRQRLRAAGSPCHLAPVMGVIAQSLELDEMQARQLSVFTAMRGVLSAAIRLNAIGPHAAQALQGRLGDALDAASMVQADDPEACASTAPLIELAALHHDRLYSRIFSS